MIEEHLIYNPPTNDMAGYLNRYFESGGVILLLVTDTVLTFLHCIGHRMHSNIVTINIFGSQCIHSKKLTGYPYFKTEPIWHGVNPKSDSCHHLWSWI